MKEILDQIDRLFAAQEKLEQRVFELEHGPEESDAEIARKCGWEAING